jgi:sugar-specific transcriptional regulator TrmB
LSTEQILNTLMSLGLTRTDSQVYIHLAKGGPQKGQDLSRALKVPKQQLYRSLKNLQRNGIVNATLEHPARFSAVSFDKVVDIFVNAKLAEAQRLQENKDELLTNWQAISIDEISDTNAKFSVIEGRETIYAKIVQMMTESEKQLSTISTVSGLIRADQFGLFDTGLTRKIRLSTRLRALTELSVQNVTIAKKFLKEIAHSKIKFEGRISDLTLNLPQMVLKDEDEILFFITPKTNAQATDQQELCLWTNCKSLVQALNTVFESFWRNSTDISAKITEIETGKPAPKTKIIEDAKTARKMFDEAMMAAEKEIIMITSSSELLKTLTNKHLLDRWVRNKIFVNIMAPITVDNIHMVKQLPRQCEIRHVHLGYLGTTVIDGKCLFQFKDALNDQETPGSRAYENTFYTNDPEYVEKTRIMLNDIWNNAYAPSTTTLESIAMKNETSIPVTDNPVFRATQKMIDTVATEDNQLSEQRKEKTIIEKIFKKQEKPIGNGLEDTVRFYSTSSQAIIHPPSHLKLPDILFHNYHLEKHSTYGAADFMIIFLWLDTPNGYFYVSAAGVTDNPEYVEFVKKLCAGTPAAENVQLVKKDELQMQVHGNTLLSAWTIIIPLIGQYVLPPGCLIVEAYTNEKATAYTANLPSGYTLKTSGTFRDAFVKFYHPSSNYSGPGTDGAFSRNVVIEFYPPKKPE